MGSYRVGRPPVELAKDIGTWLLGSILLHSAACVINDICDRDIDRQVERTKNRPLACGLISVWEATIYLFALLGPCIGLLAFGDRFTFLVGMIGIFPLHAFYPLMKRVTYWPQAWLGLAMNWGLPTAWVFIVKEKNYEIPAIFFLGTVCWTIVYDTIYGCQDRHDDVKAGVRSTSLLFGSYVRSILSIFAGVFVGALAYGGILNGQRTPYFIVTVGGTAAHLAWQLLTLDPDNAEDCWVKFKSNGNLGYITWAGMLLDYAYKVQIQ